MAELLDPISVLHNFGIAKAALTKRCTGFSGAVVWHILGDSEQLALKAHSASMNQLRLTIVHSRMIEAGSDLMPQPRRTPGGATVVVEQDRLWDLADWREGTPTKDIAAVLPAIARLHLRWQHTTTGDHASCESIHNQLLILDQLSKSDRLLRLPAGFQPAAELLRHHLEPTQMALKPWKNRHVPVQAIHGDLWIGNVLMHQGQFNGIIDAASIRTDSVVSDLARLCGNINAEMNRLISDHYAPSRPLQPIEWDLLHVLGRTGPIARLAQWLIWLTGHERSFADINAARRRFADVVSQAQLVA